MIPKLLSITHIHLTPVKQCGEETCGRSDTVALLTQAGAENFPELFDLI
jgi:hypothetical protein